MRNDFYLNQNEIKIKAGYLNTKKINKLLNTWMCLISRVDGLKICDQGRLKLTSFLQETGKVGQHQPRIGNRPLRSEVQDALKLLAHLPHFFFSLLNRENNYEYY